MRFLIDDLSDLDDAILDRLPEEIKNQISNGNLKKLPKSLVDSLPDQISETIPNSLVEAANTNPILTLIIVICGTIGILGFIYGVFKSGFKTALFFALVAICSWGYYAIL
ncbi:MAG: hypothetical protein QF596_09340 [Acidimicrobiales bacterium]|jgi:hypothetical protein|nr:hypothetical protein [Acidimicrobiales bacterium]MDP6299146.1 hypothetical protein [Acidimicrobiales bacterium]HJM29430.1 hypothetical protein [Acidimicrobiales bacterium]HJM97758.1 hypothetical protein [Acidimicrobiales bacterium]|tara:strand:+ start:189 stop:518 length:330 start_codon:yes stop_codon:yes gene_type:complete